MKKSEFIKTIAGKLGVSENEAAKSYDAFVSTITETLKKDEKVELTGFATFEVKAKPEREGINPLTKQKITIAASNSPSAKFGKTYKSLFN